MVEIVHWDTQFFGYQVGQLILNDKEKVDEVALLKSVEQFKLTYIISHSEIKFNSKNIQLVDIKTRLSKKRIVSSKEFIHNKCKEIENYFDQQLLSLALQSGAYSRFEKDVNFINDEFYKLYQKWILDSINKTIADKVIVYENDHNLKGLLTLSFKNTFTEIGLLSVDVSSRGKGIGKLLLQCANEITLTKGLTEIQVSTQFDNVPAMQLYQKLGYEILSKKYIYHLWN